MSDTLSDAVPLDVHDAALLAYREMQAKHHFACANAENVCISGLEMALRVAFEAGRRAERKEAQEAIRGRVGWIA